MLTDTISLANLSDQDIQDFQWYYRVELRPGVFTGVFGNKKRRTSRLVRNLAKQIDVRGRRVLEIGCQEAVQSVLFAKKGADVVAYDRLDLTDRIELMKEAYGVEFDYAKGLGLSELKDHLQTDGNAQFDVVMFAGVMYHMIDPLRGLGEVRSFCRQGGIVVVETSIWASDHPAYMFNMEGQMFQNSCYFVPSLAALDYSLRMLRLRPIDCSFVSAPDYDFGRLAVVCRAENEVVGEISDTWIRKKFLSQDFGIVGLDYRELRSNAPPVPYELLNPDNLIRRETTDSVDLYQTFTNCNRYRQDEEPDYVLSFADEY